MLIKNNELLEAHINQIKKEQEVQGLRMIELLEKMRSTKSTEEIIEYEKRNIEEKIKDKDSLLQKWWKDIQEKIEMLEGIGDRNLNYK